MDAFVSLLASRKEALSADDSGRVTSEAALSKHPKGRGSRPITSQDEVPENDNWARDLDDPSKPELDVRVLLVPAGCFLVSMGDPAQRSFAKRLSSELHAKRQPVG